MGSSEQFSERIAPYLAIMLADMSTLFRSKLTFAWFIAAIFLELVRVLGSGSAGTTSSVVSAGLSDFVLIWSLIMIGMTASAVSSESGEFADSVMSKSVTRFDYLFAKFSSRIIYVLAMYGAISAVIVGLTLGIVKNDYQIYGLISSLLLVALALIVLTTMGVAFSTFSPNTIIAIVSLLVVWYAMMFFFPLVKLEFLSPANLITLLPGIIRGNWTTTLWNTIVGWTSISVACTGLSAIYFYLKDV
ncbi:MAG TPA: hypothetical protein VNE86_03565 [Nitrososphaerales archaeon]|nr:hypothetical protein [Nitrososphaerales archaeon]